MSNPSQDRIRISNIHCQARIGVTARERRDLQNLDVSLELELDLRAAGRSDNIRNSLDYRKIVDQVEQTVRASDCRLIEALAQQVCDNLLAHPRIEKVHVEVRKFPADLLPRIDSVAVQITRSRE